MKMSHWYSALFSSVVRVKSQQDFGDRTNCGVDKMIHVFLIKQQQMSKHCLFLHNKIIQIKRRILHHVS